MNACIAMHMKMVMKGLWVFAFAREHEENKWAKKIYNTVKE